MVYSLGDVKVFGIMMQIFSYDIYFNMLKCLVLWCRYFGYDIYFNMSEKLLTNEISLTDSLLHDNIIYNLTFRSLLFIWKGKSVYELTSVL